MAQLKGIARNLNQLTKAANAAGFQMAVKGLDRIVAEIKIHLKRIRDDR